MSLNQLADLMDALASETWSKVDRARQLGMSMGEVTISQHNLLSLEELNVTLGQIVEITEISQVAERRVGADFEIWLERSDGTALGYSIQAKRVRHGKRDLTYPELAHRGHIPPERQYDTLLRHANSQNSIAMHVFYNGWDRGDMTKPYFAKTKKHRPSAIYGCAAIPSARVKAIREAGSRANNKAKSFEPFTFPWSDLLRLAPIATSPTTVSPGGGSSSSPPATASPPTPPLGANPAAGSGPSGSRVQFDADVMVLAEQMKPHRHGSEILASGLPDYVKKARNLAPKNLPEDAALPRFVLVVRAE